MLGKFFLLKGQVSQLNHQLGLQSKSIYGLRKSRDNDAKSSTDMRKGAITNVSSLELGVHVHQCDRLQMDLSAIESITLHKDLSKRLRL